MYAPRAKDFWEDMRWKDGELAMKRINKIETIKTELKESDDRADIKELGYIIQDLKEEAAELKEGRVLSTKNRNLVKF